MPESTLKDLKEIGTESVEDGRGAGQLPWYEQAAHGVAGMSVLDVGCGLGKGLDILARQASSVTGLDLDPRLASDRIMVKNIADMPDKAYDVVTSVEVIEHVENPEEWLGHVARVARKKVFLTTPNWTCSRCMWPYHLREYTPKEFWELISKFGRVELLKGTMSGSEAWPVSNRSMYFAMNAARSWKPTGLLTAASMRFVPKSWRIHSQNAAWIHVD